MPRPVSLILCGLVMITASGDALARADHQEAPMIALSTATEINWGGAVSRGNIRISGLRIQSARESARLADRSRLRTRKKSPRTAPGERVNRPEFGSGAKATGRPTGRRMHSPIRIRKRVDAATPLIRRAHKTKRPLPRVVIKGPDMRGELRTVELQRVSVTSLSTPSETSAKGDVAMEEITLVFEHVRMR